VDVKKNNGVGADVLPVDSSGSEGRMAVGLLPDVHDPSPRSAEDEPAEDLPEELAAQTTPDPTVPPDTASSLTSTYLMRMVQQS
jgi:hypothetical protein